MACYFAVPLMLSRRRGLIISTVAWDHDKYLNRPDHPNWGVGTFYDIAKHAIVRMIYALGIELRRHKIAAVAVAPGFMRTERVLQFFNADEQNWKNISGLKRTETPEYVGRAVTVLAADSRVLQRSGRFPCRRTGPRVRLHRRGRPPHWAVRCASFAFSPYLIDSGQVVRSGSPEVRRSRCGPFGREPTITA
jgi:NAD(P)-dependent dehydrogenase (short-subunit alcohol dehydrogenase family)